jgi:hypothetical protein
MVVVLLCDGVGGGLFKGTSTGIIWMYLGAWRSR